MSERRSDLLSRRDWLTVMGAAGAGALIAPRLPELPLPAGTEPILPLTSTSDVFIPGRGRGYQKFSFDFPEPSIEFEGYRFGFLVFTGENTYGLDARQLTAQRTADGLTITCTGLVWAGGQQTAHGRVTAQVRKQGDAIEWDVTAQMDQPVKTVTTVIRGVPRGKISTGGDPFDPRDDELLFGYPFSAGDLFGGNTARGLSTPLVMVQRGEGDFVYLSSLDNPVRVKRFYSSRASRATGWKRCSRRKGGNPRTPCASPPGGWARP